MRVAPTDDNLRPGPLTTAAGAGDHGGPPPDRAAPKAGAAARWDAHRTALAREIGAIVCAAAALAIAVWSLYALIGTPALGLGAAVTLAAISRGLAYHKPG